MEREAECLWDSMAEQTHPALSPAGLGWGHFHVVPAWQLDVIRETTGQGLRQGAGMTPLLLRYSSTCDFSRETL